MFGIFKEAAKRAKYETYASSYLATTHRFDIRLIGEIRLLQLTDEILEAMTISGAEGEREYTALLVKRLEEMGYL